VTHRQKCADRTLEIKRFRAEYGEEHTVGLSDIVATDFMSSEHSDEGVVDKVEYAQNRRQHGDDAFEIRREMWRSEQVSHYNMSPRPITSTSC
jgi:hypothetical protein